VDAADEFHIASLDCWRLQVADWVLGPAAASDGCQEVVWRKLKSIPQARAACMRMGYGGNPPADWTVRDHDLSVPYDCQSWLLELGHDGSPMLLVKALLGNMRVYAAKGKAVVDHESEDARHAAARSDRGGGAFAAVSHPPREGSCRDRKMAPPVGRVRRPVPRRLVSRQTWPEPYANPPPERPTDWRIICGLFSVSRPMTAPINVCVTV
jgi:hypothetical protein